MWVLDGSPMEESVFWISRVWLLKNAFIPVTFSWQAAIVHVESPRIESRTGLVESEAVTLTNNLVVNTRAQSSALGVVHPALGVTLALEVIKVTTNDPEIVGHLE